MPALQTGQRSTFNDTIGLKLDISDMVPVLVDPQDVPLTRTLNSKAPTVNAVKHEWLEETLVPSRDTLGAAIGDSTGTTFTATQPSFYKKGYVIQVDSEQMRISATPAANPVTFSRGYAGTTAGTHLNAADVLFVGYAVTDGADPEPFATTDRTTKFNLHSVTQEIIEVTDLDEWAQIYGVGDKFAHEVEKWLTTLSIRKEQQYIYGQRNEDTTNKTRSMGGLDFFITTNVTDAAAAPISETLINDELNDVYTAGGDISLLMVSPKQKRKITGLITASQRYFVRPGTSEAVGVSADEYLSDFGRQPILMNRWQDKNKVYFLMTKHISRVTGQPLTLENLEKSGTSRKSQIVGWDTLEVKAEKWHSILKNLA